MFVAESDTIRKNRHDNITISVFQQYWFLASCLSLLSESFATFRAITGGIIGGKTLGYIPMVTFWIYTMYSNRYLIVAVRLSGILKSKQKLGVTFNFDKQDVIDYRRFSKITMCILQGLRGKFRKVVVDPFFWTKKYKEYLP